MKKKLFNYLLILHIFLFSFVNYSYSQEESNTYGFNNVMPASPKVSQLQKYIDYPVNHNTGIPNISIPLYEINTGSLNLPINISYHASGFKVDDQTGDIGLGWSLNAGGIISRKIVNKPDEESYFPYPYRPFYTLNQYNEEDFYYIGNMFYFDMGVGGPDGEYDVFYYSAGSLSGKFLLAGDGNNHRKPVVIPYEPITITSNNPFTNIYTPINYFEITNELGQVYRYGKSSTDNTTAIEENGDSYSTAWFLKEIHSADGSESINFYYEPIVKFSEHRTDIWDFKDSRSTTDPDFFQEEMVNYQIYDEPLSFFSKRLKKIEFKGGIIEFNYISDFLKNMIVKDDKDTVIKKIVFEQNPYSNQPISETYLKLSSMHIEDSNGNKNDEYKFYYDETVESPQYFTSGVDYWGYYNGKINNPTIIPPFQLNKQIGTIQTSYADREVDEDKMQVFILNMVQYPTGGTTEFEYETNKAKDKDVGGLRIEKIINKSSASAVPLVKSYTYGFEENGMGKLLKNPYSINTFMTFVEKTDIKFLPCKDGLGICEYSASYRLRRISSDMFDGGNLNSGSNVFYEQVTEYQEKLNGSTNGKSVFIYKPPIVDNELIGTNLYTKNYREWTTNHLISKTDYKKKSQSYVPVTKYDYKYNIRFDSLLKCSKVMIKQEAPIPETVGSLWSYFYPIGSFNTDIGYPPASSIQNTPGSVFNIVEYIYHTGAKHLEQVKTTSYLENEEIVTIEDYDYGTFLNEPTSITTENSNGASTTTYIKYPNDYNDVENISTLMDKNIVGIPIDTRKYNDSTNILLSGSQVKYNNSGHPVDIYNFESKGNEIIFQPDMPYTFNHKIQVEYYNNKSKVKSVIKDDDITTYFAWAYEDIYPIIKIESSDPSIDISSIQSAINNINLSESDELVSIQQDINNLKSALSEFINRNDCFVSLYTFKPLVGVTSITDPRGYTIYYEYDDFNRLKQVKDAEGNIVSKNEYHYKNQE